MESNDKNELTKPTKKRTRTSRAGSRIQPQLVKSNILEYNRDSKPEPKPIHNYIKVSIPDRQEEQELRSLEE